MAEAPMETAAMDEAQKTCTRNDRQLMGTTLEKITALLYEYGQTVQYYDMPRWNAMTKTSNFCRITMSKVTENVLWEAIFQLKQPAG